MQLEETGLRSLSSQFPGSFSPLGTLLPSLDQGAYLLHRLLTCFYNSQSPVAPPISKFWLQPVIPQEDLKFLSHYSKFRTHQTIWKWLSNIKIKATQGKSLSKINLRMFIASISLLQLTSIPQALGNPGFCVLNPGFCVFIPRVLMIWTLFSCLVSLSEMSKSASLERGGTEKNKVLGEFIKFSESWMIGFQNNSSCIEAWHTV